MSADPENHTLRLLQEMHTEMREMREDLSSKIEDMTTRIDGNTLILNMLAGLIHNHEERISKIEDKQSA